MGCPLIFPGSPPRRRSARAPDASPVGATRSRARRIALTLGAATIAATALGASPELLDPERAFALSARGLDERTVEARFAIAPGYYLYREKLRFSVEPVALADAPRLPPGQWKQDEFFGRVETYRGQIVVRVPLGRAAPAEAVTLRVESQGCADIGVCYPPQVQTLKLELPATGARAGSVVEAAPAKKRWFQ
jgi:thioredoxin:protein disulfide reductase